MTRHNLYIPTYDWLVRVYLNACHDDVEEIIDTLERLGATDRELCKARRNMRKDTRNNGICYPNKADRMSVMVIGSTTSAKEFLDSLVHEIMHLAVHIATTDGIDLHSEEVCYIAGDAARSLYDTCKEYLCCKCH